MILAGIKATGIIVPPIVKDKDSLSVITRGGILYVLKLHQRDDDV